MVRTKTTVPSGSGRVTQCTLCLEFVPSREAVRLLGYIPRACASCFVENFKPKAEAALHKEVDFKMFVEGGFDPKDCPQHFSKAFIQEREDKAVEYATPANTRIYCKHKVLKEDVETLTATHGQGDPEKKLTILQSYQLPPVTPAEKVVTCGAYIGQKETRDLAIHPDATMGYLCDKCDGCTCAKCGGRYYDPSHNCDASIKLENQEVEIPAHWVLGQQYRLCPNQGCKAVIQFNEEDEGCNHMTCGLCRCSFCFVCGEEALCDFSLEEDEFHWGDGKCPMAGRPGVDAAMDEPANQENDQMQI